MGGGGRYGWSAWSLVALLVVSVWGWKPIEEKFDMWTVPEEMYSSETQLQLATGWASIVRYYFSDEFVPSTSYFLSCRADEDYFRMLNDPLCIINWMHQLEHSSVKSISHIEPVVTEEDIENGVTPDKRHENGGVRVEFANSSLIPQGYWKPCYGNAASYETYLKEIATFHLDKILGFYRVLPALPRRFSQAELRDLAAVAEEEAGEEEGEWAMDSILRHCGDEDGEEIEGAMIGWAPFPLYPILKARERQRTVVAFGIDLDTNPAFYGVIKSAGFEITNESPMQDRVYAMESVNFHLWQGVTGYLGKYAHNVYRMTARCDESSIGPLLYLDNDRSRWSFPSLHRFQELRKINGHPLVELCKFPRTVAERMLMLSPDNEEFPNTSELLRDVLSLYGDDGEIGNGKLLPEEEMANLDDDVQTYATMIRMCIDQHGRDSVLIEEPWIRNYHTLSLMGVPSAILQERPFVRHLNRSAVEEALECPKVEGVSTTVIVELSVAALLLCAVVAGSVVLWSVLRARRGQRQQGLEEKMEEMEEMVAGIEELDAAADGASVVDTEGAECTGGVEATSCDGDGRELE